MRAVWRNRRSRLVSICRPLVSTSTHYQPPLTWAMCLENSPGLRAWSKTPIPTFCFLSPHTLLLMFQRGAFSFLRPVQPSADLIPFKVGKDDRLFNTTR